MARLTDLPVELIDIVLSGIENDNNATLKSACLAGNRKLCQVARRLTFRDISIALQFPIVDRHPFYRRFKAILDDPSLRASVRSLSFECHGHQDSIKLSQFLNKNVGRLKNLTRAALVCSSADACWLGCISRIVLLPLMQMPSLVNLEIRGCQCLCDDYFPVTSNVAEVHHLSLEDVKLESRGSTDGWASVLRCMTAVQTLRMKNCRWSTDTDSSGCLSAAVLLKELQASDAVGWSGITSLHIGCSCEPCQWYCQADARQLSKLCECELPNLEELAIVSCSTEVFACTTTSLQDLASAFGRSLKRLWLSFLQCHCFTPAELQSVALLFPVVEELGVQDQGTRMKSYASALGRFPSLKHLHFLHPLRDPPRRLSQSRARAAVGHLLKSNPRLKSASWVHSDITIDIEEDVHCDTTTATTKGTIEVKRESSEVDFDTDVAADIDGDVKEEEEEAEEAEEKEEEKAAASAPCLRSRSYRPPAWIQREWFTFEAQSSMNDFPF